MKLHRGGQGLSGSTGKLLGLNSCNCKCEAGQRACMLGLHVLTAVSAVLDIV